MVEIYGQQAINGVIFIEIEPFKREPSTRNKSKVLFLIDGKKSCEEDLRALNPKLIDSINLIKNKTEINNCALEDYEDIILITLKKALKINPHFKVTIKRTKHEF